MKCFAIALFTATLLSSALAQTGLTGEARENFIRDVNKICLEQQRVPANANYPDAMLVFYCDCLASTVANTISPAELHSPTLQEKANVAGGTCKALADQQFQQLGQSPAR
jgi:hypothetical protein